MSAHQHAIRHHSTASVAQQTVAKRRDIGGIETAGSSMTV